MHGSNVERNQVVVGESWLELLLEEGERDADVLVLREREKKRREGGKPRGRR